MKTSPRGIEDLILSEGVVTRAYRDSVGVWTIGVGHAATSGRPPIPKAGMTITRQQAFDILAKDLSEEYEPGVRKALGTVPQHVFDGAVSFHFNTGAIGKASWVGKYKAGDMAGARKSFMDWRKPPKIIGRRTREAQLIFEGRYHSQPGVPSVVIETGVVGYQKQLAALGYDVGTADGIRGPQTIAAVKAFQKDHDLVVDGIVGPATKATLANAIAVKPPPPGDGLGESDGMVGTAPGGFLAKNWGGLLILAVIGGIIVWRVFG